MTTKISRKTIYRTLAVTSVVVVGVSLFVRHQPAQTADVNAYGKAKVSVVGKALSTTAATPPAGSKLPTVSPAPANSRVTANQAWPAAPSAPATAAHSLTLVASTTNFKAGDKLTVSLYENSSSDAVNAVQANITYDPTQLSFVDSLPSTDFGVEAATNTAVAGVIRLARATDGSTVMGNQTVVTLHFTALAASNSNSHLTVDVAHSLLVRSVDATNILQVVTAAF